MATLGDGATDVVGEQASVLLGATVYRLSRKKTKQVGRSRAAACTNARVNLSRTGYAHHRPTAASRRADTSATSP
jgi:hypothetical protein